MAEIYYFLGHEQFQPEVLVKHAQLAEQAGFDGVFVSEHLNPWVADSGAAGFAFATLAAIAVQTEKIKLMTGVVTPLFRYHPAVVAQASATIDRLSNGRFSLGVGNGEALNEAPLGYTYPDYKERAARMVEALEIMHKLFAGEKISFPGTYYKTDNFKLYSPPLHQIAISLAAGGPKSAELAGEHADGVIVSVKNPADALEKIIVPAGEKARAANRQTTVTASRWTVFAKDKTEAWEALKPWRGLRAPSRDTTFDPEALQKEADSLDRDEVLSKYTVVSDAAAYITAYKALIETVHADTVVIQTTAASNQEALIGMLGKDVIPYLKSL
jgi:G6PDH family F420-dependent oxidoreductase